MQPLDYKLQNFQTSEDNLGCAVNSGNNKVSLAHSLVLREDEIALKPMN